MNYYSQILGKLGRIVQGVLEQCGFKQCSRRYQCDLQSTLNCPNSLIQCVFFRQKCKFLKKRGTLQFDLFMQSSLSAFFWNSGVTYIYLHSPRLVVFFNSTVPIWHLPKYPHHLKTPCTYYMNTYHVSWPARGEAREAYHFLVAIQRMHIIHT